MIEKAVIDRFEENKAVLFVGEPQRQVVVEKKELPSGVKEGMWLQVDFIGGKLTKTDIDEEQTSRTKSRILGKRERLRKGEHLTDKHDKNA